MAEVIITRRGAERLASGHPWIYRSDVADAKQAAPGDVVRLRDSRGRFYGWAHYSAASEIALRLLTGEDRPVDQGFWRSRLERAQSFRRRVVAGTDAYRLVYGEADGLPAFIVDRYADWLVVQALDQGMDRAQAPLVDLLREMFHPRGIVERNDAVVRRLEQLPLRGGILSDAEPAGGAIQRERFSLAGAPQSAVVQIAMNGVRFEADLLKGQKTGAFLDQRENYAAAAAYAGGEALDCFSYAGGFALHLARVCRRVSAVDSSAEAVAAGRRNAALNGLENIIFTEANVFDLLRGYEENRRSFDTVVLDPPAFARSRSNLEAALRGYKEINLRAMKLLGPGGVLVTCSCSHHVSERDFLEIIAAAGLDARRRLTVLERRTQARDHPILLTVPETLYLKCLILLVEPG